MKKLITMFSISVSFIFFFQNCGPVSDSTIDDSSSVAVLDDQGTKLECEFVGTENIKSTLINVLEISAGDVPMLNPDGTQKSGTECGGNCMYLKKYANQLGDADLANGSTKDTTCSTTKFKPILEMYINACSMSLDKISVKERLFPDGVSNFETLYLTFTGRKPTQYESDLLTNLISEIDSPRQMGAACAAVAATLESITNI